MARLPDPTDPGPLSPDAQRVFDELIAHRGSLGEIWRVLLNHPELAERLSTLGTYLRFLGTLPDDVRETVILRTAHRERSPYVQYFHERRARLAGMSDEQVDALRMGTALPDPTPMLQAAIDVVDSVIEHRGVPADAQQIVEDATGVEGVVEMVSLCGFYRLIAGIIVAFDMVVPDTPATDG
jgi:4-carboxymuconolactone decarboxylase